MTPGTRESRRTEVTATCVAVILLAVYFIAGALGRMEGTPLDQPEHRSTLARVFPQQWAFFTKSPTEPRMFLYKATAQGWTEVRLASGIGWRNVFGFRRSSRTAGRELGMISQEFLPFEWFDCEIDILDCLPEPPVSATAELASPALDGLCGQFAIVVQEPVPWVWRHDPVEMPSNFAKFEVPCP